MAEIKQIKVGSTTYDIVASKLATARTISLTGSVTGSGSFDGSGNCVHCTRPHEEQQRNEVQIKEVTAPCSLL